jgi:TatA/E family protein of Tat protein translocase
MFNLGTGELLLIFLVILLLFGAKRLPELARGLGKGINEFKDAVETGKQEIMDAKDDVDLEGDSKKEQE